MARADDDCLDRSHRRTHPTFSVTLSIDAVVAPRRRTVVGYVSDFNRRRSSDAAQATGARHGPTGPSVDVAVPRGGRRRTNGPRPPARGAGREVQMETWVVVAVAVVAL